MTAPTASVGTVQFSVDDVPWTTATLSNDTATVSGALAGAATGPHIIVARTNQAGTLLAAMSTVNVVSSSAPLPTLVYSYSITDPYGASGYAANGNIVAYNDSVNGSWQNIAYDSLNRIISAAQGPAGSNVSSGFDCWTYDSFGNRGIQAYSDQQLTAGTCAPPSNATVYSASSMTFGNNNQISSRASVGLSGSTPVPALAYDGAGNVTGDPATGYGYLYDGEGRLCAAHTSNGIEGYLYDADGHRVAKGSLLTMSCDPTLMVNGQPNFAATTLYMLGPDGEPMTEVNNGTWTRTHVSAAGQEIATYDANGVHFQVNDWLGTRRVQTNAGGIPEASFASQPFGDCFPSTGCPQQTGDASDKHFTGKERDAESGNDYFIARYYGSSMGRFLSPDDGDGGSSSPGNPQSWNLYAYVQNNPLTNVDPDGHDCVVQSRIDDKSESVSVSSGDCSGVKLGSGQSATYVPGTVTGITSNGGNSIDIGYNSYDGQSTGVTNAKSAPAFDHPGIDGPANAAIFGQIGNNGMGAIKAFTIGSVVGGALGAGGLAVAGYASASTIPSIMAPLLPAVPSAIEKLQKLGLSLQQANAIVNNPATQKLVDNLNGGNINFVQNVNGQLVRITTDPNGQRIISAGIMRANQITNGLANGRFQ